MVFQMDKIKWIPISSVILTAMVVYMGAQQPSVSADSLIQSEASQSQSLLTTGQDLNIVSETDAKWHVNYSDHIAGDGGFINYAFPAIPNSMLTSSITQTLSVQLKANTPYYLGTDYAHHVSVLDAAGHVVMSKTLSPYNEEGRFKFMSLAAGTYTVVFSDFNQTLSHIAFGDPITYISLYEILHDGQNFDYQLDDAHKPLNNRYPSAEGAFMADSKGATYLGVSAQGHSDTGEDLDSNYEINSEMWYHPVEGYNMIGNLSRTRYPVKGKFDDHATSTVGIPAVGIHGSAVEHDVLYLKSDAPRNHSNHVSGTVKIYGVVGGYENKTKQRRLNFWDRINSMIGDPVDTYSGAFVDTRELMTYAGNNPLHFDINYYSTTDDGSALGKGYTHNFDTKLTKDSDGMIHVMWSPNVISDFRLDQSSGKYIPVDARQSFVTVKSLADGYEVYNPAEGQYIFNRDGLLISKIDRVGQRTSYEYDGSKLVKVSNDRNQSYQFTYDGDTISSVTDNTGRKLTLGYSVNWYDKYLNKVTYPDGTTLDIKYDDTRVLSMTYAGHQLISNQYDTATGKVLSQTNGNKTTAVYTYDDVSVANQVTTTYEIDGHQTKSVHNQAGDLLSTTDANGHRTTYTYNDLHQKISKTDATGATTRYAYDDRNNVISQTSPGGYKTSYSYDENNDLVKVTTADGKSAEMSYDAKHRLVQSVDKSGLKTNMTYDAYGNPLTIVKTSVKGDVVSSTTFKYDESGYLVSLTNNGRTVTYKNDALGRKISETTPSGIVTTYTYDDNNNVLTTSVSGHVTKFSYDALGHLIKKVLPNGHVLRYNYTDEQLVSASDKTDGSDPISYKYDDAGRLSLVSQGSADITKYTYDAADNVTKMVDSDGRETSYEYDALNQLTTVATDHATSHISYNSDGQVVSKTDGNGHKTTYQYDANGNVTQSVLPDGTKIVNTYDDMGRLLKVSSNGKTTSYTYDAAGNRVSSEDAMGHVTTYKYNADGQLTSSINPLGHKTSLVYNDDGQLVTVKNNRDEITATYTYDDNGNVQTISNASGVVSTITYDVNHHVIAVKDAYGQLVNQETRDIDERLVSTISALNQKSELSYQQDGSLTTVTTTSPAGHHRTVTSNDKGEVIKTTDDVTSGNATYDQAGNLASQSVNNGQNKTSYTYDGADNVVSEANNDGESTYVYDAVDQLVSWTNARGNTTTYTRDVDGNITEAKASDIDNQYTYDANGNETGAKNSGSEITKTYDALNRVVSKTQDGQTVKYTYDDREFLTDITYPGDKKVHYDINTDGQIKSMTDWNNHKTTYDYDKNGRVVKTTNWNGVIEERSYNVAGQVLTIKTSLHDKTLTDYKYSYDSEGNLINDNSQTYRYDALNRLVSGQGLYTYDAIGNITAVGSHKMTYDDDSRLTSIDGNKTTVDKDGNLTAYTMSGKSHTASYNSQNQLTKYDDLSYNYDADGNRLSAGDTKFVYDDNGHLLNDGTNTYVYGASGVVGYYNKDNKFITYLFNQRGDVVKETDESGSVANSFDYNDYGKLTSSDHVVGSVFGYGGQYGAVTDKNGLIFLRTRYYNPEIMRFMNRDTVRGSVVDTKSLNRFSYVEGNPLTYVDPNGEAATWLKNNPLDALYYGLMGLSFVPGLNIVASIGMMAIDLAKGDYTSLAMDSLGILIPGVGVAAKLSYKGVRAVVDGLRATNELRDVVKLDAEVVSAVDVSKAVKSEANVGTKATETVSEEIKYEVAIRDQVNDRKILEDAKAKVDAERNVSEYSFDKEYSENDVRFSFSKKYKESGKGAKTDLPNAHNPQRHHILQNEWAEKYLSQYGYKKGMAPTITLETGKEGYPHTIITNSQNSRRNSIAKISGDGFEYGLSEAMQYARQDLQKAGLSEDAINHAMSLVDDMLSHLNVPR